MDGQVTLSVGTVVAIFGVIGGVVIWPLTSRFRAYDKHLEECRARNEELAAEHATAVLYQRKVDGMGKTLHWLGDCMMTIGGKLDVDLPVRPEKE